MKEILKAEAKLSTDLIATISRKLSTSGDHYRNISDALEILCHRIGASKGLIKLYSRYDEKFVQDIIWPSGTSTKEEDKVAQSVIDTGNKPYFHTRKSSVNGNNRSFMGIPLLNNDYPLGVAVFTGGSQEGRQIFLQNDLANYIPLLIVPAENMVLHRVLIESYLRTIESLAIALEVKDNYTIGHSNMVMAHALAIANEMGLDENSLDALEIGSLMHDIGKIGVRDEVLQKPSKLTEDEFEEMKQHPLIGEQILLPLKNVLMELPRKIVRWHHEQACGKGYPDGLVFDQIPLEVRIVSVADVFEALTAERPYRNAIEMPRALEMIQGMVPRHLDGEIVEVLKKLML
ncbi:MAG: HD domain-containing phosphohydrolase [bacterium]